tara:strand:- start:2307 stop:5312 length:3006 start_codon:yes stop_codon:yes gene_type:complete
MASLVNTTVTSAAGSAVALTAKGGNDLVDNILLNLLNQSGATVLNVRNNGAFFGTDGTFTGDLTVTKSSGATRLRIFSTNNDPYISFGDNAANWEVGIDRSSSSIFQISNSSGVPGTSVRMAINSNGNVGIGTTDPGQRKLEVVGAGNFSGIVSTSSSLLVNATANGGFGTIENRQDANTNADGIATVNTGGSSLRLWVDGDHNRIIGAGSTNVFSFTTSAISLLHPVTLTGTLTITSNNNLVLGNGANNTGFFRFYNDNSTAHYIDWKSTGARAYQFLGSSSSADYVTTFKNAGSGGHDLSVCGQFNVLNDAANTTRFYVSADGVVQWGSGAAHGTLTWDTDKAVIGGIGTNNLSLVAEGTEVVNSTSGTWDFKKEARFPNNTGLYWSHADGTATAGIKLDTSDHLDFRTGGSNGRMTLDDAGNLGISRTSPYGKLDIESTDLGSSSGDVSVAIRSQSDVGSNTMYLLEEYVRKSAGTDWTSAGVRLQAKTDSTYQGYVQFNGDSNNYGLSFGAGAGGTSSPGTTAERMRIQSDGNVGIGTTDPAALLEVGGNADEFGLIGKARIGKMFYTGFAAFGHRALGNVEGKYAVLQDADGGSYFNAASGQTVSFRIANADQMVLSSGQLKFVDNKKIIMGTGNDLEIYHDGSHSYIQGTTTGDLYVTSENDDVVIRGADDVFIYTQGGEDAIIARGNAGVDIFHDNIKKFETTGAGVTITGTATATTFSGSGASLTSLNGSNISSGTVAAARLGSGSSITTKFLRGDNTWQTVSGGSGTVTSVATSGAITGGTITTSGTISHSTANGYKHIPADGADLKFLAYASAGTAEWAGGLLNYSDYALFAQRYNDGSSGGALSGGQWNTRILNTTVVNNYTTASAWASLGSNQITLQAGTYYARVWAVAYDIDEQQINLANVNNSNQLMLSAPMSARGNSTLNSAVTMSEGTFAITTNGHKLVAYHWANLAETNTYGGGRPLEGGSTSPIAGIDYDYDTYVSVQIWRVA